MNSENAPHDITRWNPGVSLQSIGFSNSFPFRCLCSWRNPFDKTETKPYNLKTSKVKIPKSNIKLEPPNPIQNPKPTCMSPVFTCRFCWSKQTLHQPSKSPNSWNSKPRKLYKYQARNPQTRIQTHLHVLDLLHLLLLAVVPEPVVHPQLEQLQGGHEPKLALLGHVEIVDEARQPLPARGRKHALRPLLQPPLDRILYGSGMSRFRTPARKFGRQGWSECGQAMYVY
jgi:hypothetical protein